MKREIKFRGLRVDKKEWVYGDVIHYREGNVKILEQNFGSWDILEAAYDVIPETVGQFTELRDKNGKEIYEGDKVIINGENYFIHFGSGIVSAVSYTLLPIVAWQFIDTDITVVGNIHEK